MTELGTRLKEARLEKGLSLDDLQEITKIQKRYLVGIEEGEYSTMPGAFYVRAFVKQYAEAVGLNPSEILDQYKNELPDVQNTDVVNSYSQSYNRRKLAKSSSSSKVMETVPKIIVALFAIAILIVFITLVSKKMNEGSDTFDETDEQVQIIQNPVTKDPEVEDEEEEKPEETEPVEVVPTQVISDAVQLNKESFEYIITETDRLNVRVDVLKEASWIGMKNEIGVEQLGNDARAYNAGETISFDATENKYVRIRLGRALNVKVFVNDVELPLNQNEITQNIILKLQETAQ